MIFKASISLFFESSSGQRTYSLHQVVDGSERESSFTALFMHFVDISSKYCQTELAVYPLPKTDQCSENGYFYKNLAGATDFLPTKLTAPQMLSCLYEANKTYGSKHCCTQNQRNKTTTWKRFAMVTAVRIGFDRKITPSHYIKNTTILGLLLLS